MYKTLHNITICLTLLIIILLSAGCYVDVDDITDAPEYADAWRPLRLTAYVQF